MQTPPALRRWRRGNYTVIYALLVPALLGMLAFSIDFAWISITRSQNQDVADAAAHAALVQLRRTGDKTEAESAAQSIIDLNEVGNGQSELRDIRFGVFDRATGVFDQSDPRSPNAVEVDVDRVGSNAVPVMFAKYWGRELVELEASAQAAGRSLQVVVVIDITISFKDKDFYKAREAAVAFLDILEERHAEGDQLGLATFNYTYGVAVTPMFNLSDSSAVNAARSQWNAMETTWRGSVSNNTANAERYDPCSFESSNRRAAMPRAYKSSYYDSRRNKWRTWRSEHATDHVAALLIAEKMLDEAGRKDPLAYQAIIMLTDGKPFQVHTSGEQLRRACGYEEKRWDWVAGPIPHSKSAIADDYQTKADELGEDVGINLWNISFVADNAFLDYSTQGDGRYYLTEDADELKPIFVDIANSLPVAIVD